MEPLGINKCRFCGHVFKSNFVCKRHEKKCCGNEYKNKCTFCPVGTPSGCCKSNNGVKSVSECVRNFDGKSQFRIKCIYYIRRIDTINSKTFEHLKSQIIPF